VSMRRLARTSAVLTMLIGLVGGVSGCTGGSKAPPWRDASAEKPAGASTPEVCGRIRTAITGDMKPLGTDLGTLVGYASADDDDGRADALKQADQGLKDFANDIQQAASQATDQRLVAAVTQAVGNINALIADKSFLGDVDAVSDIPDVSRKLDDATHPIAVVCS
jgi:hypothetical protein